MRYLVAIVFAIVTAGAATLYLSSPVASWIVSRQAFDSPDQVADLHALLFMAMNLFALAAGWTVGWWLGGRLARSEEPL